MLFFTLLQNYISRVKIERQLKVHLIAEDAFKKCFLSETSLRCSRTRHLTEINLYSSKALDVRDGYFVEQRKTARNAICE